MRTKQSLVVLCESVRHLHKTPFISQLYPVLCQNFDVKTISLRRLKSLPIRFGSGELVLSLLR